MGARRRGPAPVVDLAWGYGGEPGELDLPDVCADQQSGEFSVQERPHDAL